jgi:hypothetical protein
LERLAATDRLHGDLGLELGAMGAAFAHRWEPPLRGSAPPHRLTKGPDQKTQTTSDRPPPTLCCATPNSLPATQGQRYKDHRALDIMRAEITPQLRKLWATRLRTAPRAANYSAGTCTSQYRDEQPDWLHFWSSFPSRCRLIATQRTHQSPFHVLHSN